jgi:outer membrane receptor protein involved in Fe transport
MENRTVRISSQLKRGEETEQEKLVMRINFILAVGLGVMLMGGFCSTASAAAAPTPATQDVTGTVNDALGRPIPAAAVTLQDAQGKNVAKATSDSDGHFTLKGIAPGVYAVLGNKQGFKPATSIVTVKSTGAATADLILQAEAALSLRVATTRINPQSNGISETGNSQYSLDEHQIEQLPEGENTPIDQVLLQAPGAVQDDEGQIHIEGEHEDLQWRVNGVMMPMDSFSGFGQIFNSFFVKQVSLLTGVLPVTYGYRDAGVLDLVTKDGCSNPGGNVAFYGGQRETTQPSFEYGGCEGPFSYYFTGTYLRDNLAFSSATPGPTPYHNITNQGQGFGYFTYEVGPLTKLSLVTGVSVNHSEYPSEPGLAPMFTLAGHPASSYPSQDENEHLNQDYYFGALSLSGVIGPQVNYQVGYTAAYNPIKFSPDGIGDLIYQGVAAESFHTEFDNTLQTDVSRVVDLSDSGFGSHNLGAGFYLGEYGIELDSTTLAFKVNSAGMQTPPFTPIKITADQNSITMLYGVYLQDIWEVNPKLTVTAGIRYDGVSGIVSDNMPSPRINFLYKLTENTILHAGYARYFQTPDFDTISPKSFTTFQNTTAAVSPGGVQPLAEKDNYWNAGFLQHVGPHLTLEENAYFRLSHNLIDLGQFGFVPIFVPFNYMNGRIYGSETSAVYTWDNLSVRANFTYSVAQGNDVVSGQFNFSPAEVAYITNHYIYLDHSAFFTGSGGITYKWNSFLFSMDGQAGSGLRAGFANTVELPQNYQMNFGITKSWQMPNVGKITTRVTMINAFDKINELRNGTGVGIFEPGYGPRRAVYGGVTIPLPAMSSPRNP